MKLLPALGLLNVSIKAEASFIRLKSFLGFSMQDGIVGGKVSVSQSTLHGRNLWQGIKTSMWCFFLVKERILWWFWPTAYKGKWNYHILYFYQKGYTNLVYVSASQSPDSSSGSGPAGNSIQTRLHFVFKPTRITIYITSFTTNTMFKLWLV